MAEFINENEPAHSSNKSPESDNDGSVVSSRLRRIKKKTKYNESDNFITFTNEGKAESSKQNVVESSKGSSKRGAQSGKNKKNTDVQFSSDEEIEDIKNLTFNDIDFNNPKQLLENPEELEDLDIRQYYHNPVRWCFDDPRLAFVPMCFLCGSFGNEEEFIFCNLWGESFHPYCVKFTDEDRDKLQEYWKCLNCKYCEVCSSGDKEKMLLYCDVCDKAYHTFCLKPRLNTVPSCGWKWNDWFKCMKCGTTSFFKHREDYFISKKIDYSISKDFSLCIECSIEEYHKNSSDLKCEKWGEHLKFTSEDIETRECLNCLVKNKMWNSKAIAIKNCEYYLKIHQISTRHSLLSFLCKHILAPFLDKFDDAKGALIKLFVDENSEFFREDIVIMEWLKILEMSVKFENEEVDSPKRRGGYRKAIKNNDNRFSDEKPKVCIFTLFF